MSKDLIAGAIAFFIVAGIYLGGTAAFVAVIVLTARALGVPI